MHRTRFVWDVTIADEDGKASTGPWGSFWSPDKVEPGSVANAAAAEATVIQKKKYLPIAAKLRAA
jgi:ssDNA-binding replication factor A large subunit